MSRARGAPFISSEGVYDDQDSNSPTSASRWSPMSQANYYIINLQRSLQESTIWLLTNSPGVDTWRPEEAMRVTENQLVQQLDKYDNGASTRAIRCDLVDGLPLNRTSIFAALQGYLNTRHPQG